MPTPNTNTGDIFPTDLGYILRLNAGVIQVWNGSSWVNYTGIPPVIVPGPSEPLPVYPATASSASLPLAISNGGTGASTSNQALINLGIANPLQFKGVIDASGNPNYPAAQEGWTYIFSVGGKIGGAAGEIVEAGVLMVCTVTNGGGTQAAVGADFTVVETTNGAVIGPVSAVSGNIMVFNGTSGAVAADGGVSIAQLQYPTVLISNTSPIADPGGSDVFQFNSGSAIIFNAPAGVVGMQRTYRNATGVSGVITIQMASSNTVDLNGANGSSAGTLVSTGVFGDAISIVCDATNHWYAFVSSGVWVIT